MIGNGWIGGPRPAVAVPRRPDRAVAGGAVRTAPYVTRHQQGRRHRRPRWSNIDDRGVFRVALAGRPAGHRRGARRPGRCPADGDHRERDHRRHRRRVRVLGPAWVRRPNGRIRAHSRSPGAPARPWPSRRRDTGRSARSTWAARAPGDTVRWDLRDGSYTTLDPESAVVGRTSTAKGVVVGGDRVVRGATSRVLPGGGDGWPSVRGPSPTRAPSSGFRNGERGHPGALDGLLTPTGQLARGPAPRCGVHAQHRTARPPRSRRSGRYEVRSRRPRSRSSLPWSAWLVPMTTATMPPAQQSSVSTAAVTATTTAVFLARSVRAGGGAMIG